MIRDKYNIYGEKNDPNTITSTTEIPNNALVLGAGDKTIKAVTSFPRSIDGLLIQRNNGNTSVTDGSSLTSNLINGEPSTVTFDILNQVFEIDFPLIPVVSDTTTVNTITKTVYPILAGGDYYKFTITIDVFRRTMLGENIPYYIITFGIKDSSDVSVADNVSISFSFNYYCPINFDNSNPGYNIRTINIEYDSADPTYGGGQIFQTGGEVTNIPYVGTVIIDIDITKDTYVYNQFGKSNLQCGITVYNGSTQVLATSGYNTTPGGLELIIPAGTIFTSIVLWDDN